MGNNTATITPDAETTAVETITAATGELLHIDPAELVLDDNVRTDPVLGKDFIASIATGVRLPLYAVRDADGTVKVRDGQRRTFPRKWRCCIDASWRMRHHRSAQS